MLEFVGDWAAYLALDVDEAEAAAMPRHDRAGRPLGTPNFIDRLKRQATTCANANPAQNPSNKISN